MFYSGDANDVPVVMEADAVVADPQPELRRFDVPETLDIAFADVQIAGQHVQDTEAVA